jgi:hypothetical protein
MRKLVVTAVAVTLGLPGNGVAAPHAVPPAARSHPPASLPSMLRLRLRSMELQIDTLSDRGAIGREQARDLRADVRRLEQRLDRASGREAREVELAADRLQYQLRVTADAVRSGNLASARRDLDRFDDGERFERDDHHDSDRDTYQRPDPRGDPFAKWEERDERGPH